MIFGTDDNSDPVAATLAPPGAAAPAAKRIRDGSEQQEAFWTELQEGTDHVLLEARAGSGKSSSAREGMWRLLARQPNRTIRYCCFNKKIADEFAADCPPGVTVGTMHRFSLEVLARSFGSKVEGQKTYTLLDQTPEGANLQRYVRKSISTLVSLAKNHGYHPAAGSVLGQWKMLGDLITAFDIETWRREEEVIDRAVQILERSAEVTTLVDFDDMLWLPVIHGLDFPAVDDLFIDEAQDLNSLQHELAERMSGSGRTIVIGDPFQAIYAWRGAASDSIPRLRDRLGAKTLYLTVSWRCPRSHVALARELVPDFTAAPDAAEGTIRRGGPDLVNDARPGDLVLCRANAPIVSACLAQIARRKPAIVRGRAIGEDLIKVLARIGDAPTVAVFARKLTEWRSKEILRLEAKDGTEQKIEQVTDQAACLEAVASSCSTPAEVPAALRSLFSDNDAASRVTFSSVHRAKGSEARNVTYIQIPYSGKRDKLRPPAAWEIQQRKNLRYVALSRSLDALTLVS